jgi:serine protease Do
MKHYFSIFITSFFLTTHLHALANFTEVAETSIPSVVSVKVKCEMAPQKGSGERLYSQDPMDLFGERFFERFFSVPNTPQKQEGQASGFIVSKEGYVITNAHVVKDATEVVVILNNEKEFVAKIIGTDPSTDIAVVKIEAKDLPYLELGNSDELKVGQWVLTIGNPLGLQASVSAGVVSAKGRNNLDIARIEDFIQTDAAINKGNSGGPLMDLEGKVIGMNTAILSSAGNGGGYMGIGFAIPSNMIKHIMEDLIDSGSVSRGFMGIAMQRVDHNLAQAFGLDHVQGALISEVTTNSPAEKAGLKQGDIITHINNKVVKDIASLRNAVALHKPGAEISLTILRNGNIKNMKVIVGNSPDEDKVMKEETTTLGLSVKDLTPEVAKNLNLTTEIGVVVVNVEQRSAAAFAGIQKGNLIMAVNQKPMTSVQEFEKAIKNADPKKPLLLLVKQGKVSRYISIKMH